MKLIFGVVAERKAEDLSGLRPRLLLRYGSISMLPFTCLAPYTKCLNIIDGWRQNGAPTDSCCC